MQDTLYKLRENFHAALISLLSMIFITAAVCMTIGHAWTATMATQNWHTQIWPVIALALGFWAMDRCKNYGVLVGLAFPSFFATALGLYWSSSDSVVLRTIAISLSVFFLLLDLRICVHMVSIYLEKRYGMMLAKVLPFLFVAACGCAGFEMGYKDVYGTKSIHGMIWTLLVWGAVVLIWRPSLVLRTLGWLLSCTIYRMKVYNVENYPDIGPAMLVANHISFLDFLFILCLKPRKVTFLVDHRFYRFPGLNLFFRWSKALEVPERASTNKMRELFDSVHDILNSDGVVCIFPEGVISPNGMAHAFRSGITKLLPRPDIPVIPVRLGLHWGSLLTIFQGKLRFIKPRLLPIPGTVIVGEPIPQNWSGFRIWQKIAELGAEAEMKPIHGEKTIPYRFLRRTLQHPFDVTFKDADAENGAKNLEVLAASMIMSKKLRKILAERGDDGQFVGVLLPNKVISIEALFAVQLADRVPAVLNYTVGDSVMDIMCSKAKLKTIITSKVFLAKLKKEPRPEMIFLEDLPKLITKTDKYTALAKIILYPHQVLIRDIAPKHGTDVMYPAALLFSSGSTGTPKGVMLSHHNITSDIWSFWRQLNWHYSTDRIMGNLPLFHAFGLMVGLSFPSVTGTQVILVTNPLDGAGICKTVKKDKVTMLISTPTFLLNYMRHYKPGDFDSLRMMVTGAEKLQRKVYDDFKALTGKSIIEGYGCTEMSPIVSLNIPDDFLAIGKESGPFGSIGVAMQGIASRIVDVDTGELLDAGKEGLLQLKSASVMMGYLDDPEAMKKAITPDGWYNTNDIASMDRDGYIRITGRLSRFSKIGGEMVPHELIEQKLEDLFNLDGKVAVSARPDSKKGEQIIVFYSDPAFDPQQAGNVLRENGLPNLWIPRPDAFFLIAAIPLLGNGKKDLKKLKEMARTAGTDAAKQA